jgi:hypothetical protein
MRAAVAEHDRADSDEALVRPRRGTRRWIRVATLAAIAAIATLILLVALSLPRADDVRTRLEQGRRTLETARGLLLDGESARAPRTRSPLRPKR